jgi:peptidylamidoglycolate lyase
MLNRRQFLGISAFGIASGVAFAANVTAVLAQDALLGHGDFKYRVVPGWGQLDPEKHPVRDCHGMVQDSQGRIILLTNHTANNVIVYDKAGNLLETWGTTYPGAHGLAIVNENGQDFLYITDHDRHQVFKTTMTGEEVMVLDFPKDGRYTSADQYKPTDVAPIRNGDFFVCDGYGQNWIIKYDNPGEMMKIFGGKEIFNTPHGACVDYRDPDNPVLIVTSRGEACLERFTLDGEHLDVIDLPGSQPCNIYPKGEHLFVPHLNGFVSILDKDNKVVSNPGGSAPEYVDGKLQPMQQTTDTFMHPHSILVDDEDDVYVPQWNSGQTYPIKLERVRA